VQGSRKRRGGRIEDKGHFQEDKLLSSALLSLSRQPEAAPVLRSLLDCLDSGRLKMVAVFRPKFLVDLAGCVNVLATGTQDGDEAVKLCRRPRRRDTTRPESGWLNWPWRTRGSATGSAARRRRRVRTRS
jgi:hypothetical protein